MFFFAALCSDSLPRKQWDAGRRQNVKAELNHAGMRERAKI
jgi:hypothetical protein